MKKSNLSLIIFVAGAVIWAVNVIVDIAAVNREKRAEKLAADSLFLAAWATALAARLKRLDSERKSDEQTNL